MVDNIKIIRDRVPYEELLCGLAEEATELAQAALKLRRAITRVNPTPVTAADAYRALVEEIADVNLCLEVMNPRNINASVEILATMTKKAARWAKRLESRI